MDSCLVAVPVYNEQEHIEALLRQIATIVPRKQILVVDDGSNDGTLAILQRLHFPYLRHSKNRGKGAALKSAIGYALKNNYDWLITLDGDGQHDPRYLREFIAKIEANQADFIIGNRFGRIGRMPFHRVLSNGLTSIVLSLCSGGQRVHDSQCGFRAVRTSLLIPGHYASNGFQLESEMILRLGKLGVRFAEIPISTIYYNQKSSINLIGDTLKFLMLVIKSFFW